MKKKIRNISQLLLAVVGLLMIANLSSCKKFLEVDAPSTSINEDNVYASDATAIAVMTDLYSQLVQGSDGGFCGANSISLLCGLSADELTLHGSVTDERLKAYYRNQLSTSLEVSYGIDYWRGSSYSLLFTCNAAIQGLNASTGLTDGVKEQLLGEATFMRALLYFYLVNLYGDVPLPLTTNPNENRLLPRLSQQQVYERIVTDLKDAQTLLSISFLDGTLLQSSNERVRPTKWAATALLARTYLYMTRYAEAEAQATRLIDNTGLFSLCASIDDVFLKNSTEAIWQLQPVRTGRNTEDAFTFKLLSSGPNASNNPVYISQQLLGAFETIDPRRKAGGWIDSVIAGGTTYYFPAKYKATTGAVSEYQMMFRLAEQYLIRAEARARQNNIAGAKADLDAIRTRAGISVTNANDQHSLVTGILNERQVELFTELGQRWFDLKRTGKVDAVMTAVTPLKANGAVWQSYQQLYPIMYSDIQKNPSLTQNAGY